MFLPHRLYTPTNFIDWPIDKGILPDLAISKLFMYDITPEQLRSDMYFMLRTRRRCEI